MSDAPQTPQSEEVISAPQEKPLLTIHNFHFNPAPSFDVTTETPLYYGYFENHFGDQWVLNYDFDTETGVVRCGDAGWENMYAFLDGRAPGITTNEKEKAWLQACWAVISVERKHRDQQRHEAGTDLKSRLQKSWKTTTADGKVDRISVSSRPVVCGWRAARGLPSPANGTCGAR